MCCIATVPKATELYAPVFQEMVNKVTWFLKHLPLWDEEDEVPFLLRLPPEVAHCCL